MQAGPKIVSTESSRYFAERIAELVPGASMIDTVRKRFGNPANGERYLRLALTDRAELFGEDVIVVASTVTDEDIAEVVRVGSAIAKYGARRVIYVVPFFGYSTMERAVKPGEVVTAKVVARQLSHIPSGDAPNCFLFLDLHVSGLVHYFEGECRRFELYAEPVLAGIIEKLGLERFMFASADLGRPRWVEAFAKRFKTDIAFVRKTRNGEDTEIHEVIGDVRGKEVVIYDDMTRSGNSLLDAAYAYLDRGATGVHAALSHFALNSPDVFHTLKSSEVKNFITTNSHPLSQGEAAFTDRFLVQDVSPLFADVIWKILR